MTLHTTIPAGAPTADAPSPALGASAVPTLRCTPLDLFRADPGDQLQEPFAVIELSHGATRAGDPMLRLRFANERGQKIGATVFGDSIACWRGIRVGDPVLLTARVSEFRGTKQLDVVGIMRLPKPHPVLMAMNEVCPHDRYEAAIAGFERHLRAIRRPGYRLFVHRFFEGACPEREFLTCPAAKGNHHAYIGGLLEHSVEVTDFAVIAATQALSAPAIDLDLLRTACLMHDAGKVVEYTWLDVPIGMARLERLYNHLVTGPIMTWLTFRTFRAELEAAGFTERDALQIMHVQASHHGRLAWGSPIMPRTAEANLAHAADQQSAQLRKLAQAIESYGADEDGRIVGSPSFRFGLMAEPEGSRVAEPAWADYEQLCAVAPALEDADASARMLATTPDAAQVVAEAVAPDDEGHSPADDHGTTAGALRMQLEAIQHDGYRRFVDLVLTEACSKQEFLSCPLPALDATETGRGDDDSRTGGLATYTLAVTRLAVAGASSPGVRDLAHLDLVRAAALLHAVGAVRARRGETGALLPVTVLGPVMLHEAFFDHRPELEALGFTVHDLNHLVHAQVSYPGTLDEGAASAPATLTAQLVHSARAAARTTAWIGRR